LYRPYPQLLENIKIDQSNDPLSNSEIQNIISEKNNLFKEFGRIVIRKSGTEPLIRVMAEHENFSILQEAINDIVQAIKRLN
jgi:phosphoglucosamine mutase